MKKVGIAELKANLSKYVRAAQRGETVTVFDRDRPVAQIVPVERRPRLTVIEPAPGTPKFNEVQLPPPLPLPEGFDIVDLLLEERQNHR